MNPVKVSSIGTATYCPSPVFSLWRRAARQAIAAKSPQVLSATKEGMKASGESGSVVSLLCDSGERYRSTYYNDAWLAARGIDTTAHEVEITRFFEQGV